MKKRKFKTSDLIKVALGAAIMCVLAPVSFPVGAVPVSLATLGVYLVAAVLGKFKASVSVLVYVGLGMLGLPVFSGFTGGIARILWSGGGFIIGYVPCAFITGLIIDLMEEKRLAYPLGMLAGTVLCYACGVLWYMFLMNATFTSALTVCVVPFLIFDTLKITAASFIGYSIRNTVKKL